MRSGSHYILFSSINFKQCANSFGADFSSFPRFAFQVAQPSPTDLSVVGEHPVSQATLKMPAGSKIRACEPIFVGQVCVHVTLCVCVRVCVQGTYFKIRSRVCPLVIVASHVDKSEPHCVQRVVLKSIMDPNVCK